MAVSFEEAKELLANCTRQELHDRTFGDTEVYFYNTQSGTPEAEGYTGMIATSVRLSTGETFEGQLAEALLQQGKLTGRAYNDGSGD